ncbi:Purple acid phosphatase [Rhynchospora pubera]|uniref:Purple acid phosphatase n=1 Tax=Rhynchospora pubera TaxID=906938 RepID=A0AAV8H1X1_9POAL|nr:Purple acid phosphatase [Rhynchospora pubera]
MGNQRLGFHWGLIFVLGLAVQCNAGVTSTYRRRLEASADMPLDADVFQLFDDDNPDIPQQIHITQGDYDGSAVIVSWITQNDVATSTVHYGTLSYRQHSAQGNVTQYKYSNYTSGYIHHCTLMDLEFNSTYGGTISANGSVRTFSFTTPPEPGPDVPYTFGIIGDLGQTFDSNSTLTHYNANPNAAALLYVGDFSYADNYPNHDNVRWDTWGRFIESSTAYQPWIWTFGNHELDFAPEIGESIPFKPVSYRYQTPYSASGSTEQYYYSVRRASAHIIVLASYSSYGEQNSDSLADCSHACAMHRVSNIAYNITNANCSPVSDNNAPVYITVGDGGNAEGLSTEMTQPQPSYSAFREASFGHGIFDIKNKTHALFEWHRNQDGDNVVADSLWLTNRYFNPTKDS